MENKETKRARLLAKAAEAIDEYLEWEEQNPGPDLTQIEDIALKLRKEFGQEIAQVAIENQAERTQCQGRGAPNAEWKCVTKARSAHEWRVGRGIWM